MEKLIAFCTTPTPYRPREWQYYRVPAVLVVVDILLLSLVLFLYSVIGVLDQVEEMEPIGVEIASVGFLVTILLISVYEELLFRIIPLWLAFKFAFTPGGLIMVALITAIGFGYIHGGPHNILIQGIGGFFYAILFIKYASGGKRIFEASIVVIVAHTIFNGLIGLLLILSGETVF